MKCQTCRLEGQHKIYTTFDYWYCPKCKEEIEVNYNKADEVTITIPDGFTIDLARLAKQWYPDDDSGSTPPPARL